MQGLALVRPQRRPQRGGLIGERERGGLGGQVCVQRVRLSAGDPGAATAAAAAAAGVNVNATDADALASAAGCAALTEGVRTVSVAEEARRRLAITRTLTRTLSRTLALTLTPTPTLAPTPTPTPTRTVALAAPTPAL